MRLLVCTDNFWIGGRETFLASYLRGLRGHGVEAGLIATQIANGAAGLDVFDSQVECLSPDGRVATWRNWLERGDALIRTNRPNVIWAQHFELLPAWLLAMRHGIPLLVTFHGPLSGGDRIPLLDAIGMTLAIRRGGMVSAVSPELAESIGEGGEGIRIIPNAVEWPAEGASSPPVRLRRVACIARSSKLGHLRAAARLFGECRRRCGVRDLTVAGGIHPAAATCDPGWPWRAAAAGRMLGFRWSLKQGPAFAARLARIRVSGPVANSGKLIAAQDGVFGMGRVVLEAMAAGRPAVLIGYDEAIDVIDGENFDRFAAKNFSGRGAIPNAHSVIAGRLSRWRNLPPLAAEQVARFSLAAQTPMLHELLEAAARQSGLPGEARDLADVLADGIARNYGEAGLFEDAYGALSDCERRVFHQFSPDDGMTPCVE